MGNDNNSRPGAKPGGAAGQSSSSQSTAQSTNRNAGSASASSSSSSASSTPPPRNPIDRANDTSPTMMNSSSLSNVSSPMNDNNAYSSSSYSAIDSVPSTPINANHSSRSSVNASGGGTISSTSTPQSGDVVTLSQRNSRSSVSSTSSSTRGAVVEDVPNHPEVDSLLRLAQFYPLDPSGPPPWVHRPKSMNEFKDITPQTMRASSVIDVYAALQQRWAGVGVLAVKRQITIGKEMDKMEHALVNATATVHARNGELRQLVAQLQQLPDLHRSLQKQQYDIAVCMRTLNELNLLLPPAAQLEDMDNCLLWAEGMDEEVEEV